MLDWVMERLLSSWNYVYIANSLMSMTLVLCGNIKRKPVDEEQAMQTNRLMFHTDQAYWIVTNDRTDPKYK